MISLQSKPTVLLLMTITGAASAQDLVEIEVVGRQVNLIGVATSASEGRVSHNELERRALLRTGEVLESVLGLVATQHSGSGKANQYFLRGINLDHGTDFATSIDGMPVNMRSHGHGQGYTDLNFLIPELIEEIEYRKGSYHADVGDFSGAGSAKISTLEHAKAPEISVALGSFDFARLLVRGGVENTLGQFIYGIEHQVYDGPWDSVNEDIGKTNVWIKQQWSSGDDDASLTFMAYDNSWNSADQIPERAVNRGLISALGSIDTTVGGNSSRYSLSANWTRAAESSELRVSAYGIAYEMELWSNFSYFIEPEGDQFKQVDERRIYGGEVAWESFGQLGELEMSNTFGSQLRVDDIDRVGLQSTSRRQFLRDIRLDSVQQWSASLFWQNELRWTERLRSVVGLRHDYYDFDVTALAAGNTNTLGPNSGKADANINTASLSLIYQLTENHELYAAIGEGFHSNDARGVTIALDPLTADVVEKADPLVDTLVSEIGLRAFISERLNATIALWQLDIDSELIFVGDAGNTEDTGVASERYGLEVTGYFQFDDRWSMDFEYAWTDAQFKTPIDGSREIPAALDNVVSAGLNMNLNDRINANLRVRHFDDFPLDGGALADGSTMLNFRLAWQATDALAINLDILNLTDSDDRDIEYFYESQLASETMPVEDRHFHVFEPRSLRLYMNYTF
jgi:outer membrane receptor protein involved in Fe transport